MVSPELEELASACGLLTSYEDVYKRQQQAPVESLLAVLNALGVELTSPADAPKVLAAQQAAQLERGSEPVIVAWDGKQVDFDLTLPVRQASGKIECMIALEGESETISDRFDLDGLTPKQSACGRFVSYRLQTSRRLPGGYHRLTIENAGRTFESLVISAPRRAYSVESPAPRDWGCFLPLYALRGGRNWGAGDFTDLQDLAAWTEQLGGRVVGTLPMLAAFLDEPFEPSPYAPASRLAWNEFYIDVAQIPEMAACAEAAEIVQSVEFTREVTQLRQSERVDYARIMARKRKVLELLAETFFQRKPADRYSRFEQFLRRHPHVEDYAAFRAAYEWRRQPWEQWPDPMREGRLSDEDYEQHTKNYHLFAQWTATEQLETLADSAGGGLYLDLPLGVRSDGYDVWRWSDVYTHAATAGSPPDAMWTTGQNWGFPPLHPEKIREQGYRHVRDYLRHHLRLARLLRVDHVMQLHRLYWIPHAMSPREGVYVRYRPDEFYAILNLESHRTETTLIGENLGTVPPEVDRAMDEHNMKRMYVVQYEVASSGDSSEVPAAALASLNTHDMPTFAAWWQGVEISLRQQLGLLSEVEADRARDRLKITKDEVTTWLRSKGWLRDSDTDDMNVLVAILNFLAASESGVVLVNLEDLWLETEPQNVPGTGPELPNWKRKARRSFEEFTGDTRVLQTLREIDRLRNSRRSD